MPYRALLVGSVAFCLSCTTVPAVKANSPSSCEIGKVCVVRGTLTTSHKMGSIREGQGCIAVALPESVNDDWDQKTVEASGMISKAPDYPGLVTFKLKGRNVDAEACYSGLVMFVDRIRIVSRTPG